MQRRSKPCLAVLTSGLALAGIFLNVATARADQIVSLVDEHGHRIFVNTSEPVKRPNWMRGFSSNSRRLPTSEINALVQKTASRLQVDPHLIHAIIQVESEYNPRAVSRKGALGLMQLAPYTASRLGVSNPFDPKQNIEAGVTHLRYLLDLFGGDIALSLAAYNAGTLSVQRYGGIPSFPETKSYVRKVWGLYQPGSDLYVTKAGLRQFTRNSIYRYIDSAGVVHFTNIQ
jgi:soluble lytic murein transglycosylase